MTNYLDDIMVESGSQLQTSMVVMVIGILRIPLMGVAPIFAKKIQTDEVSLLNILIPVDGHFLGPDKSRL